MENNNIEDMKEKRLRYLNEIYSLTEANPYNYATSGSAIASNLGYNENESKAVVNYLQKENLIDIVPFTGSVSITHEGIREVEQAYKNPEEPTKHFSPVNIINVNKIINSQIQQGVISSNQFQENKKKVEVRNLRADRKKGYIAGAFSLFLSIILIFMIFKLGWDLTGQILTVISAFFGILGIGSFIKPDSIGIITSNILEHIAKNGPDGI